MSNQLHNQFSDYVLAEMAAGLQDIMIKAAEPIIQQALKDIEAEMRQTLAAAVVGVISRDYSVERMGNLLSIRVSLGELKK